MRRQRRLLGEYKEPSQAGTGRCCTNRHGPDTMLTDRILTCRCDMTLVGRGRSSDSGSHSRGRPHSPAQLDSGAKTIADDGRVAEERVLHPRLQAIELYPDCTRDHVQRLAAQQTQHHVPFPARAPPLPGRQGPRANRRADPAPCTRLDPTMPAPFVGPEKGLVYAPHRSRRCEDVVDPPSDVPLARTAPLPPPRVLVRRLGMQGAKGIHPARVDPAVEFGPLLGEEPAGA